MIASTQRRVVITGLGLVSPLGNSPEALWAALAGGVSGVRRFERGDSANLPCACGAEAWDFTGEIENFGPLESDKKRAIKKGTKMMCREIQMGVASAQLALSHAGLTSGKYPAERTGVSFGSDYIMTLPGEFAAGVSACLGESHEFDFSRWGQEGLKKVEPLWLLKYLPNMPASHIAIYNELRGPSNSLTHREASANLAVAEAYCTIVRGSADTILAGATGTRIHPIRTVHVVLQEQIAASGENPAGLSRPFDKRRSGMVVGEGSGAVILEELQTALARGATIYGEVLGYGSSSVLDRRGVSDCAAALKNVMTQALRTSGLAAQAIGHIHAHGLSTLKCDAEEAAAINAVFAGRSSPIPVVAAKSYFGNLGAGSGVVELIASLLAMQQGVLFPVLNYESPDPDCPLNIVTRHDIPAGDICLNLNVTPQGQASALIVRRFK